MFHDIERVFAGKRRTNKVNMGQYLSKFIHHECDDGDSNNEGAKKRATKEVIIYTYMIYMYKLTITFYSYISSYHVLL